MEYFQFFKVKIQIEYLNQEWETSAQGALYSPKDHSIRPVRPFTNTISDTHEIQLIMILNPHFSGTLGKYTA